MPNGTSVALTWPQTTTNGSLLIALLFNVGEWTLSPTPSSTGWTVLGTPATTDAFFVFKITNAAPRSGTETFTWGATSAPIPLILMEWSGGSDIQSITAETDTAAAPDPVTVTYVNNTVTYDPSVVMSLATAATSSSGNYGLSFTTRHSFPWQEITDADWHTNGFGESTDTDLAAYASYRLTDADVDPPDTVADTDASSSSVAWNSRSLVIQPKAKTATTFDINYLVANAESSDYKVYFKGAADLTTGAWSLIDTVTPATAVVSDPVAFATGFNRTFYTNHRFATLRAYNPTSGASESITNGPAGRCVAVHKNRVFVGGTVVNFYRLYYSNINDETTWGANDYIDIGRDDGEPIEEIVPFRNALFIGKKTSLWYLSGSGPDTFSLTRLPTGGIAPGRSLMPTPYGVICAGNKHIWMADSSGEVTLISRPVSDTYAITTWASMSFINDVVSIVDAGTGTVWSLDLSTGVWYQEKHDNTAEAPAVLYNYDYTQLMAPRNGTTGTLLSYRNIPGSSLQKDFDTLSTTYKVWTPEMWPVGPGTKITPRHLMYKVRQRGGTVSETGITVYTYGNGAEIHRDVIGPWPDTGVYRERLDVGGASGIDYIQFRFEQTVPSGQTAVFDIEELMFGYDVEPRR